MDADFETRLAGQCRTASATFRFGIEEEYFLLDPATMRAPVRVPHGLFDGASAASAKSLQREMLQAQVEVATRPHVSVAEARHELLCLRQAAAEAAARHDLQILASGTHPTGNWRQAVHTPQQRYDDMMDRLQMIGQRNMLCGMHVHVELPDATRRIEVMTRMIPYVPLFLALSTSSPFWESRCTGLKGYRLAAYDELPRTGLPDLFTCQREYDDYIRSLIRSGVMEDASHIWWAIRPSHTYPTLELRAADSCTRLEDALAIAALYRALARYFCRTPPARRLDTIDRSLAVENKWRAQRYGTEATFATRAGAVPIADVLDGVIEMVAEDAEIIGGSDAIRRCRAIITDGASADIQIRIFEKHGHHGPENALAAVNRWIATTTLDG